MARPSTTAGSGRPATERARRGRRKHRIGATEGVHYRARRHPLWLLGRTWGAVLLATAGLAATVVSSHAVVQVIVGSIAVGSELYVLARLVEWAKTWVEVGQDGLRVVREGHGTVRRLKLAETNLRLVQGKTARQLGYAHVSLSTNRFHSDKSDQYFLTDFEALRQAILAAGARLR